MVLILDGPMGTELLARGVPTPLPGWSAHALTEAPDTVRAIHRDYAAAGARVHTANTFRTRRRTLGERWAELARLAVSLAREAVPTDHRVAGSIAPLEDCYRPDLSPADADAAGTRDRHRALADVLAEAGCDLLLCETFPHVGEARLALEAARATGLEVWAAFTPGPDMDLMTPAELAQAGRAAVDLGARAVLVNCAPATGLLTYLEPLRAALDASVEVGAYANAGHADEALGWRSIPGAPERYAELAATWVAAGATLVGGCCGTGPDHIRALGQALGSVEGLQDA